jgi:polyhydroxybutyrate depolymerase
MNTPLPSLALRVVTRSATVRRAARLSSALTLSCAAFACTHQPAASDATVAAVPDQDASMEPATEHVASPPAEASAGSRGVSRADGGATQSVRDAGPRVPSGPSDAHVATSGAAPDLPDAGRGPGDGGAPSAPSLACSGKTGATRGKSAQTVMAAGMRRSFIMHVPATLDPNKPVPLLVVPHGYTQAASDMYDFTNYPALADREGFVAVFPDGQPGQTGPWNVGQGACASVYGILPLGPGDDQAFLDAMVATVERDHCVDREHIFISGWSMGGFLTNETGCLRTDIRAIAPHSGGTHDLSSCVSKRKPAIIFHGTGDQLIPVECGKEARKRWAERNGCSAEVEMKPVKRGHCEHSKGCPADGQVVLCLFDDMNHGWAGGPDQQVAIYPSAFSEYQSAAELAWDFFKTHAW